MANLAAFNKSQESLSSVYSSSTSGERYSPRFSQQPVVLDESGRSYSSSSTATMYKSPLGAMRLADHPEVVVMAREQSTTLPSEKSDSDIDDAATLQARLSSVKATSNFGGVASCHGPCYDVCRDFKAWSNGDCWDVKPSYMRILPLTVRKTRGNSIMDNNHTNSYLVT